MERKRGSDEEMGREGIDEAVTSRASSPTTKLVVSLGLLALLSRMEVIKGNLNKSDRGIRDLASLEPFSWVLYRL